MQFLILTHESYLLIHKVFKRENKASNEQVGVYLILVNLLDEFVKLAIQKSRSNDLIQNSLDNCKNMYLSSAF